VVSEEGRECPWSGPNFGRKRNRSGSCNVGAPLLPDSTSERECADAYERSSRPPSYPTDLTNTSSSSASDSCIESRERYFAPLCGIFPCHLNITCPPGLQTANRGITIHFTLQLLLRNRQPWVRTNALPPQALSCGMSDSCARFSHHPRYSEILPLHVGALPADQSAGRREQGARD
jgi:hypothetical protein